MLSTATGGGGGEEEEEGPSRGQLKAEVGDGWTIEKKSVFFSFLFKLSLGKWVVVKIMSVEVVHQEAYLFPPPLGGRWTHCSTASTKHSIHF